MSIDKFGRGLKRARYDSTFKTRYDEVDFGGRKLKNIGEPVDGDDAITKSYVKGFARTTELKIEELEKIIDGNIANIRSEFEQTIKTKVGDLTSLQHILNDRIKNVNLLSIKHLNDSMAKIKREFETEMKEAHEEWKVEIIDEVYKKLPDSIHDLIQIYKAEIIVDFNNKLDANIVDLKKELSISMEKLKEDLSVEKKLAEEVIVEFDNKLTTNMEKLKNELTISMKKLKEDLSINMTKSEKVITEGNKQ